MKLQTCQYLHKDALNALASHQLLSALLSLQGLATSLKQFDIKEEIDNLLSSYQMMLSYLTKGAHDPQRYDMYESFCRRAYELCDVLDREGELMDETSFYTTSYRTLQNLLRSHFNLSELLQTDVSDRNLFEAVWLSPQWTAEEEGLIYQAISNNHFNENLKCLLLSATTLSAIRFFDIAKYKLLLKCLQCEDIKLRVRALVGWAFVHISHSERIAFYPQVELQLKQLADSSAFLKKLELLQLQLFLSVETKEVEKKLQEKILPKMMENFKKRHSKGGALGVIDLNEEWNNLEANSEWSENEKELSKYMNEFMELQHQGADMYMNTFRMLKQSFSFFNSISNWFYPFTLHHKELPSTLENNKFLKVLLGGVGLCDSDKYSFCLMSSQFSHTNEIEQMGKDMFSRMPEMAHTDQPVEDKETFFKEELRSYVQGCYRFNNLFLHHKQFVNPFQQNVSLLDYPPFNSMAIDGQLFKRLANFLFKNNDFELAKNLFERIVPEEMSADMYQKQGYCCEKTAQYEQARECYERANLLQSDSKWTLRRLAYTNLLLGETQKALSFYNELESIAPEDAQIALHQAECYIRLEQYDEAFKYLFKTNYLDSSLIQANRALAWCSLVTHKFEQAEKYYTNLLASNHSIATDYLNAGHAAWLLGNVPLAVQRYAAAKAKLYVNDGAEATNLFAKDKDLLLQLGLKKEDLVMMTDALMVNNEQK